MYMHITQCIYYTLDSILTYHHGIGFGQKKKSFLKKVQNKFKHSVLCHLFSLTEVS